MNDCVSTFMKAVALALTVLAESACGSTECSDSCDANESFCSVEYNKNPEGPAVNAFCRALPRECHPGMDDLCGCVLSHAGEDPHFGGDACEDVRCELEPNGRAKVTSCEGDFHTHTTTGGGGAGGGPN